MRFGDPSQITALVLSLSSGDFWGTLLMLNLLFRDTTFNNLQIQPGSPLLFLALFQPLTQVRPKKCSWFFQYRYNWPAPYGTYSFDHYID